jgi:spermidine/putrescine transport system ATP-binding protein
MSVQLEQIKKAFGQQVVIPNLDLEIKNGEFITLLGPSGCGKTTLLRMIAGFETPTEGVVRLEGQDITHLPPYKRNVNTVFQNYALFPHLNVYDNVGYGLKQKGISGQKLTEAVKNALEMVQMADFIQRKPKELSGGQQQRIALARAIVNRPKVLLLDEPLAALDLKLRKQMQFELKQLHRDLGITFVFVTHDQEEALTMSDRIAVINKGVIEQLANPQELYDRPATKFVADFIGENNTLTGTISQGMFTGNGYQLKTTAPVEGQAMLFIRPEHIYINLNSPEGIPVRVRAKTFLGHQWKIHCLTDGGEVIDVTIKPDAIEQLEGRERCFLTWNEVKSNIIKT